MNRIVYATLLIGLVSTSTAGFAANRLGAIDPNVAAALKAEAYQYLQNLQSLSTSMGSFESTQASSPDSYANQYTSYGTTNSSLSSGIEACQKGQGPCLNPSQYPAVEADLNTAAQANATAIQDFYTKLPDASTLATDIANFQQLATKIEGELSLINQYIDDYATWSNNAATAYGSAVSYAPPTPPAAGTAATKK